MRLHTALAKAVEDLGGKAVFGLLGDANLYFGDSIAKETTVDFVAAAHEAGAVLMANGYAATSAQVGFATVTHGPAFSNTITPLIEATRNSTPLVLIAGDTDLGDEGNLQDVPQEALVAPTGAGFIQVHGPEHAVRALATAVRRARSERRPIVLNLPRGLQREEVDYDGLRWEPPMRPDRGPTETSLDQAAGLLAWAQRPIILAGHGAIDAEARTALVELAALLGAPLATTLRAKDLFRGEPLDLGVFGTLSSPTTLAAIAEADCVAAFGSSLNRFTTDAGALLNGKRVLQCNLDESAIGANVNVDEALVGDAGATARGIAALLAEAGTEPSAFYTRMLATPRDAAPAPSGEPCRPGTVDIEEALDWIERAVPARRHLTVDVGRFMVRTLQMLSVPEPLSYVHSAGVASIGLGVANAIGAWKGRPDRPSLAVVGDGGFMLGGLTEFNTAVRHEIDLIVVVMNDRCYGAEHIQLTTHNVETDSIEFEWPEFAAVAESLGGRGLRIKQPSDLERLPEAIENRDRPLLIDVKLDPNKIPVE